MLKIGRDPLHLARLTTKSLAQATIREVDHLQALIVASPEPFFQEMGEHLLLIGRELKPPEEVGDSIDVVTIDETGAAIIIELERSEKILIRSSVKLLSDAVELEIRKVTTNKI